MGDYELGLCIHHAKHPHGPPPHLEVDLVGMPRVSGYHACLLEIFQEFAIGACPSPDSGGTHADSPLCQAVRDPVRRQSCRVRLQRVCNHLRGMVPSHKTGVVCEPAFASAAPVPRHRAILVVAHPALCAVRRMAEPARHEGLCDCHPFVSFVCKPSLAHDRAVYCPDVLAPPVSVQMVRARASPSVRPKRDVVKGVSH